MQKLDLAVGTFLAAFFLLPAFCSGQTISIVSGSGQLVCINCPLSAEKFAPLMVQVNDATGKGLASTTVTWTNTQPDGVTTTATSMTDVNGLATYNVGPQGLYIGPSFFPFTVIATALGNSASFAETVALTSEGAVAPVSISLVPNGSAPPALTGTVDTTASVPIVVSVTSIAGILGNSGGLPGIQVKLQSNTTGLSVTCATQPGQPQGTILTDTTGIANCYPVFGDAVGKGTYSVVVGGNFTTLAAASLTVNAGPPSIIKTISSVKQTVNAGVKLTLTAEVTDMGGNPSNQAAVVWSASPSGYATLSNVVSSSTTNGQVSATVTPTAGPVTVTVALASNKAVQAVFTINVNVIVTALQLVSGDGQQAKAGAIFTDPLLVQVNDNGTAVAGAAVTFSVTSGSATLNPDSAAAATTCASPATSCTVSTDANGQAPVIAMAGSTSGAVAVTASIASGGKTYTQTFNLTILPPFEITAVVNAAGFDKAREVASPCSLVTIYGTGLAGGLQGVVVPFIAPQTQVAGVTVRFAGVAAPILYVANLDGVESVSAQVPCEVPASTDVPPATVPMDVTVDGSAFPTFPVAVTAVSPGIFQFTDSDGQIRAVLVRQDGSFISVANPARPGDILRMFVTGLGQTTPPLFTDEFEPLTDQNGVWVPQDLPVNVRLVVGVNNSGVQVLTAKYAYGMVGVYEVDFQVPENTPLSNNAPFAIAVYQNQNTTLLFGNPSLIPIQ